MVKVEVIQSPGAFASALSCLSVDTEGVCRQPGHIALATVGATKCVVLQCATAISKDGLFDLISFAAANHVF